MTESLQRFDPASVDIDSDSELLTVTNPRLEQYGADLITDRVPLDKLLEEPRYSISECAKFFFARSAHWIRHQESIDNAYFDPETPEDKRPDRPAFVLDGERLTFHYTAHGSRHYTLADVEHMAHALAQNYRIDGSMLNNVLTIVEAQCRLYRYI